MDISKLKLTCMELLDVKLNHYTGKFDEDRPDIMHFIHEVCKAQVEKVISMFEPVELEALGDEEILESMQKAHPEGEEYPMWNTLEGRLLREVRAVSQAVIQKNQKEQLFRMKEEKKLPTTKDLRGLVPDFTGDMKTEDYIRSLRE